jgi:hypothetical protein
MQYNPVAGIEEQHENERELSNPDENPLHLDRNFIPEAKVRDYGQLSITA